MERIAALVAAGGAAWEVDCLRALERAGVLVLRRCVDLPDLLASAAAGQATVAVVSAELPDLDGDAVGHLQRHDVRVVAVAPDIAAHDRLLRLGITAFVRTGPDRPAETAEAVRAAVADAAVGQVPPDPDPAVPRAPAGACGGRVVAVWGPAGAPGRSTVAAGLAAERALEERCVLLDADPYGGSIAQMLGVLDEVSGLLAGARLANTGSLDAVSFAACRRRVGDRLEVLTGLPRADRWREVRAGVLDRILDLARDVGDVVVDCGFSLEDDDADGFAGRSVGRNQLTLDAIAAADEVVVVGAADPVGLSRLARGLMELRDRAAPARVRVVVNRMRDSLGWREHDIRGMVEGYAAPVGVHLLPEDRTGVDRALVAGRCLVDAGDGPLRRALAVLADAVFASLDPSRAPSGHARARRRRLPRSG